jgi:hypothetical protein
MRIRPTRQRLRVKDGTRRAAVLVPLCNVNNQHSVLFTLRSLLVGTHKGQVSFPGGHRNGASWSCRCVAVRRRGECSRLALHPLCWLVDRSPLNRGRALIRRRCA